MIDWTLAGTVILSGMVIVFMVLILLIGAVNLMGRLLNPQKPAKTAPAATEPEIRAPALAVATPAPEPVVQEGIALETIAAISAAVAVCMEESAPGAPYVVSSISRKSTPGARPAWGFAGMRQNTEPF